MTGLLSILLLNLNPSKGTLGRPYDSTSGLSEKGQMIFFLVIVVFGLYVGLRVWWSLRKEKKKRIK